MANETYTLNIVLYEKSRGDYVRTNDVNVVAVKDIDDLRRMIVKKYMKYPDWAPQSPTVVVWKGMPDIGFHPKNIAGSIGMMYMGDNRKTVIWVDYRTRMGYVVDRKTGALL